MFGWLFRKKDPAAGYDKGAIAALHLIDQSIRQIHPDRFFNDDLEIAINVQPCRVLMNNLLGRHETERFFALDYEMLVAHFEKLSQKKLLDAAMNLMAGDSVLEGLTRGIYHEHKLGHVLKQPHSKKNLGYEVQASTKSLIGFLNHGATTKLEPMPKK